MHLAELDLLGLVEVASRAQHHEQHIAVPLQLGALVSRQRVLDDEGMDAEFVSDFADLFLAGPVQPDPAHPAAFPHALERLAQALRILGAHTVHVDRVVDDRHRRPSLPHRGRAGDHSAGGGTQASADFEIDSW